MSEWIAKKHIEYIDEVFTMEKEGLTFRNFAILGGYKIVK